MTTAVNQAPNANQDTDMAEKMKMQTSDAMEFRIVRKKHDLSYILVTLGDTRQEF